MALGSPFFQNTGLARDAVDGGKIHIDGVKAKPSKIITPGLEIEISRGQVDIVVIVRNVREDRRPASEAQLLYEETAESIKKRETERDLNRFSREDSSQQIIVQINENVVK